MSSSAVKKPMSSNNQTTAKGKLVASNLKKKIETSNKNQSIPQKVAKFEEKGKATTSKTPVKKVVKRERKVYSLPGQKHDPPEEREPLRIFYETLSKQIPTSEMAEFWLMEHGMLSPEKAKKAFEKKQRKQKQIRTGIPIKSPPPRAPPSRPESSNRPKLALKNGDPKASIASKNGDPKASIASKNGDPKASIASKNGDPKASLASKNGDPKPKRKFVGDDDDDDDEVIRKPKQRKA